MQTQARAARESRASFVFLGRKLFCAFTTHKPNICIQCLELGILNVDSLAGCTGVISIYTPHVPVSSHKLEDVTSTFLYHNLIQIGVFLQIFFGLNPTPFVEDTPQSRRRGHRQLFSNVEHAILHKRAGIACPVATLRADLLHASVTCFSSTLFVTLVCSQLIASGAGFHKDTPISASIART